MSLRQVTSISPSQIELHEGCARKWWLNKVMGKAIPQHPSAALGELVHKGQEDFLETGDEKRVHPLAKDTLPLLRSLRERGVRVEHTMKRQLRNGLMYNGRIDILDMGARDESVITVLDWKTTGSPAYAKTQEEIRHNIQMLSYGYEATILDIDHRGPTAATPVVLAHVVIPTKGGTRPFVTQTDPPLTLPEIREGWSTIQSISDKMLVTSKIETPDAVPGNKSMCSAFGGCPFRETCAALERSPALSVPVSVPNPQENSTMSVTQFPFIRCYSKVVARLIATELLAEDKPATPQDVAHQLKAPVEQVVALQSLGEAGFSAWEAAGKPDIVAFATARSAPVQPPAATVPVAPQPARGIVAPEAATAAPAKPAQAATEVNTEPTEEEQAALWELLVSRGWSEEDIESMHDEAFDAAVKLDAGPDALDVERDGDGAVISVKKRKVVQAAAPVEATPAEPRRRGRKPGSKNRPKEVQVAAPAPAPAPAAPVEVAFEHPPAAAEPDHSALSSASSGTVSPAWKTATEAVLHEMLKNPPGLALFIDCLPVKGVEVRRLEDMLAPVAEQAAKSWKNPKTGQVEAFDHYTLIPFGGGVQMVAAGVMRNLPLFTSGAIVVNTALPLSNAVLEVLLPVATVVVRGLR